MCVCMYIYIHKLQYTQVSLLCQLNGPRGNNLLTVMSILSPQVLVFDTILQPYSNTPIHHTPIQRSLGETADSRAWVGTIRGKVGHLIVP